MLRNLLDESEIA